jgi:hypothetical protein
MSTVETSLWWYAWNSVFAPRQATRRLLAEDNLPISAYRLIAGGSAALIVSAVIVNVVATRAFPESAEHLGAMMGTGIGAFVLDALIYAAMTLAMVPPSVLLWQQVFGYNSPKFGVWVAVALGFALLVLLSPIQEIGYVAVAFTPDWLQWTVLGLNLALFLWLTSFYYSEALQISYGRAAIINTVVTFAVVLVLVALIAAAIFVTAGLLGFPEDGG